MCFQGEPIYDLYVPISGGVEVRVDGVQTATLPAFSLVGEASLLENLQSPGGALHPPSRATIVAPPGTTYVRWPQSVLYELQEEECVAFARCTDLALKSVLPAAARPLIVSAVRLSLSLFCALSQGLGLCV